MYDAIISWLSILRFETFQQRNTNSSIEESLSRVEEIQNLCIKNGKTTGSIPFNGFW